MKELHKKRIKKIITVSLALLVGGYIWLNYILFVITQEAPYSDGIWANEDGSFIFDTDNSFVEITNGSSTEIFQIAYRPGLFFQMNYPIPDNASGIYGYIHRGEIYRIFNFIHVKCEDGCFDTWLKKVEPPVT